ncbi:hypothetical protein N9219_05320 [bacterium]|nr:hypothetical protein [bacterium]
MATKKTTAMTKKSSSKRSRSAKKSIPAQRYLRYNLTNSGSPGTETSHYIDLARDLSRVNRRLYRQGRMYHIKRITVLSSNTVAIANPPSGAGAISVSTVPDTWVSREAWKRGFQTFTRMNKVATEQTSGDISGTWADFKVYMSLDMKNGTMLTPRDNGNNNYNAGEWAYSQMVTPDGTTTADEFELTMLGDHNGAAGSRNTVGLIKSYGESRATVFASGSPAVPGDADDDPLINIFDYGTTIDDVVENLEFDNDFPPYDPADYPGDDQNGPKPAVIAMASIYNGSAVMSGCHAFAGLLELETKSPIASDVYQILVELSPGKYRGISAESI